MAARKASGKKDNTPAKKDESAVVPVSDFSEFGDADGFEGTDQDDFATPILKCLQPGSPSIMAGADGHKVGMVINTSTSEVFPGEGDDRIVFIPSCTTHEVLEWKPNNGGLVGRHTMDSAEWAESKEKCEFPKFKRGDNDMVETYSVYGVVVGAGGEITPCMIPFSSTGIKGYKNFMARARSIQDRNGHGKMVPAKLFSRRYVLGVAKEKNEKGTFFNFNITLLGGNKNTALLDTSDAEQHAWVQAAHGMIQMVREGELKVDYEKGGRTDAGPADDGSAAPPL